MEPAISISNGSASMTGALRRAADRGVMFGIHPDAHSIGELNAVITGTWVARKAGLSPKQIFNTKSLEEVEEFFEARKAVR